MLPGNNLKVTISEYAPNKPTQPLADTGYHEYSTLADALNSATADVYIRTAAHGGGYRYYCDTPAAEPARRVAAKEKRQEKALAHYGERVRELECMRKGGLITKEQAENETRRLQCRIFDITPAEQKALTAIWDCEDEPDTYGEAVMWLLTDELGLRGSGISGIVGSLAKKGYVSTYKTPDGERAARLTDKAYQVFASIGIQPSREREQSR
jgi:DNA-binding MarR family transcriptional regulator